MVQAVIGGMTALADLDKFANKNKTIGSYLTFLFRIENRARHIVVAEQVSLTK